MPAWDQWGKRGPSQRILGSFPKARGRAAGTRQEALEIARQERQEWEFLGEEAYRRCLGLWEEARPCGEGSVGEEGTGLVVDRKQGFLC